MKVAELIQLLEVMPPQRDVIIQDIDGDAVLAPTGLWCGPPANERIQVTTTEV